MGRGAERLGFAARLLLLLAAAAAAAAVEESKELQSSDVPQKEICNYTVIIETSCMEGSDTLDHVSIRFGDSSSNDIVVRHLHTGHRKEIEVGTDPVVVDDMSMKPFQKCATNAFKVRGKCIRSQVCYLYLKQRGYDDWRPGRAQVYVPSAPELSSSSFYFRRFLPRRAWHGFDACAVKVTPFGMRRTRKVFANKHNSNSP